MRLSITQFILFHFSMRCIMPAKKRITKEMILTASINLLRKGGMEAISIKALANALHCSTQPIYLSFANMEELRKETSRYAVEIFVKEIQALCGENNVHLYGLSYVAFAKKDPKLFQFLFMRENAFTELKDALRPIIDASINELMGKFQISREEADILHDQLWVHTHGIAAMIVTGFCHWDMNKACQMIQNCEEALTQKYEK